MLQLNDEKVSKRSQEEIHAEERGNTKSKAVFGIISFMPMRS